MKLRYPEDGYTRPAIIFFRAIGRLALRPRSQPAIPTTCQHPPFFFSTYLPPSIPERKVNVNAVPSFHPLVSPFLLSRIVDISSSLFFSSPSPPFWRIMTKERWKMRRRESWRRERVFPTRGAESLESRAHGYPRKSLFFASRRCARGIRKGSIEFFFF